MESKDDDVDALKDIPMPSNDRNKFVSTNLDEAMLENRRTLLTHNKGWSLAADESLQHWKTMCQDRMWMHEETSRLYWRVRLSIGMPAIVLGALVTVSLGIYSLERLMLPYWFLILVILVSAAANVISGVYAFFNPEKKAIEHSQLSERYRGLVRRIQVEYNLEWFNRIPREQFFNQISNQYDRLAESSETIPKRIQQKYYKHKIATTSADTIRKSGLISFMNNDSAFLMHNLRSALNLTQSNQDDSAV
jgi:hypothetical protein